MASKHAAVTNATEPRSAQVTPWIEGKDRRLEVMSAVPLVLSTPVGLLAEQTITDKKYLFVRNIQDLAKGMTLEPLPLEGWEFELVGLIKPYRVVIHAEELLKMDQVEYEMILQCSGNGRSQYRGIPGTPWNQGGVGNVRFAGVPLKAILEKYSVMIDPQVKYVTAEGHDLPMGLEKPDFEHSLPVAPVLERSIFALTLNGEPLPGIHGGPVRLVTPGLFGTMQVKWLRRLRFETAESTNFYHATEYRVPHALLEPGEKFRFTMENSRPTWDIRLMSYILHPESGAKLKAGPSPSAASRTTTARHAWSQCWCRSTAAKAGSRRSSRCPTVPMLGIGGQPRRISDLASMRCGHVPSTLLGVLSRSKARSSGIRMVMSGPASSRLR